MNLSIFFDIFFIILRIKFIYINSMPLFIKSYIYKLSILIHCFNQFDIITASIS